MASERLIFERLAQGEELIVEVVLARLQVWMRGPDRLDASADPSKFVDAWLPARRERRQPFLRLSRIL